MSTFLLTGSQTVGPFFSRALLREDARRNVLTKPETAGERIRITLFSRGLLNHVVTRMYFEDEASNAGDPVLECVPADRRATLLARRVAGRESDSALAVYRFDIVLQGVDETAFFNL